MKLKNFNNQDRYKEIAFSNTYNNIVILITIINT